MAYPITVQFLMDKYGFRGATAIIAAVHAHTILSMVALQPIEWHHKIKRIPVEESEMCKDLLHIFSLSFIYLGFNRFYLCVSDERQ